MSNVTERPQGEGWVEIALESLSELETPGTAVRVDRPEVPLTLWLWHRTQGEFLAVWRVCTHGACEVVPRVADEIYECPCHGSQFNLTGQVLLGPAMRPLRQFEVVRAGPSLFLRRT